jgi:hypothetical protein
VPGSDQPQLLATIDQADRAALYNALGLTITYRRVEDREEVKLTATFQSVDLECAGGDLKGYSPPPNGFIVGPEIWLQRPDSTIGPMTGDTRPPPHGFGQMRYPYLWRKVRRT